MTAKLCCVILWGMKHRSDKHSFCVTQLEYLSRLVPPALDKFSIALVSDVHNRPAGGPEELAAALRELKPDIIAVTGDLVDRKRPDINAAMDTVLPAVEIAPVYFVSGNHEHRSGQFDVLLPLLTGAGVRVLEDASSVIEKDGARFILAGLRDPAYTTDSSWHTDDSVLAEREEALQRMLPGGDTLCVLLSHRPELLSLYARCGVPLVLSGHAHGGQVRLPGIPGLYAPGQGLFPRYTSGMYRRFDTAMVVSRGLGGRQLHLRICNKPELMAVRLRCQL